MQVVMRMFKVADRILAAFYADGLVCQHLNPGTLQQAFVLLGNHIGDSGLAGIEVIPQLFHLISILALGHFRQTLPFTGQGIKDSGCMDDARLHVVFHVLCLQGHVSIGDGHISVIAALALAVRENIHNRVACGRKSREFKGTVLLHCGRVGLKEGIRPVQRVSDGAQ